MRLLLIEDDLEISQMLKQYLETENFEVQCAFDGEEACEVFGEETETFSLVLLDLMIPKISGIEVLQYIRETSLVPVLILSAKDTETDKTLGLGLGADDYITKPFSMVEVLARIKANIRRSTKYASYAAIGAAVSKVPGKVFSNGAATVTHAATGKMSDKVPLSADALLHASAVTPTADLDESSVAFCAGDLTVNPETYSVTKSGRVVTLTAKEFEILCLFLKNPKKVYTKAQLYAMVWNDVYMGDENAVNVHISRLRNKIEDNPREPKYIVTVWGIGYKLGDAVRPVTKITQV